MSVYSGSVTVVEIAPVEERRRSRHFGRSPDVVGKKMSEVASWKGDDAPGDSDYAKGNKSDVPCERGLVNKLRDHFTRLASEASLVSSSSPPPARRTVRSPSADDILLKPISAVKGRSARLAAQLSGVWGKGGGDDEEAAAAGGGVTTVTIADPTDPILPTMRRAERQGSESAISRARFTPADECVKMPSISALRAKFERQAEVNKASLPARTFCRDYRSRSQERPKLSVHVPPPDPSPVNGKTMRLSDVLKPSLARVEKQEAVVLTPALQLPVNKLSRNPAEPGALLPDEPYHAKEEASIQSHPRPWQRRVTPNQGVVERPALSLAAGDEPSSGKCEMLGILRRMSAAREARQRESGASGDGHVSYNPFDIPDRVERPALRQSSTLIDSPNGEKEGGRYPDVVGKKMSEVASRKGDDAPGDSDYAKGNKSDDAQPPSHQTSTSINHLVSAEKRGDFLQNHPFVTSPPQPEPTPTTLTVEEIPLAINTVSPSSTPLGETQQARTDTGGGCECPSPGHQFDSPEAPPSMEEASESPSRQTNSEPLSTSPDSELSVDPEPHFPLSHALPTAETPNSKPQRSSLSTQYLRAKQEQRRSEIRTRPSSDCLIELEREASLSSRESSASSLESDSEEFLRITEEGPTKPVAAPRQMKNKDDRPVNADWDLFTPGSQDSSDDSITKSPFSSKGSESSVNHKAILRENLLGTSMRNEPVFTSYGIHGYDDGSGGAGSNPVRRNLLSLVMEEDIPLLLESMAEECRVEFEDYSDPTMSNCSSILIRQQAPPSTDGVVSSSTQRREESRNKSPEGEGAKRLRFIDAPPQVYAYLDEDSVAKRWFEENGELGWQKGCRISYVDYQQMMQRAQEEIAHQFHELAKWRDQLE